MISFARFAPGIFLNKFFKRRIKNEPSAADLDGFNAAIRDQSPHCPFIYVDQIGGMFDRYGEPLWRFLGRFHAGTLGSACAEEFKWYSSRVRVPE